MQTMVTQIRIHCVRAHTARTAKLPSRAETSVSTANAPEHRCKRNSAVTPTALSGETLREIEESRATTTREQHQLPLSRTVSHEMQTSEGATTERPESSNRASPIGKYAFLQLLVPIQNSLSDSCARRDAPATQWNRVSQ